jgi:hypothetical protein
MMLGVSASCYGVRRRAAGRSTGWRRPALSRPHTVSGGAATFGRRRVRAQLRRSATWCAVLRARHDDFLFAFALPESCLAGTPHNGLGLSCERAAGTESPNGG